MSPPGYGVVGIATYFWYEDPGVVEVPVSVRGWTGTATVTLDRYSWSVGNDRDRDGAADVVTGPPGTAETPSATYVYDHDGLYPVVVSAHWSGTYTVTNPDGFTAVAGLDDQVLTAGTGYPVVEIQAVIGPRPPA
ncbi:MAG: hypothetical protein ACT4PW_00420 [Acidimicrobiia bacterium]